MKRLLAILLFGMMCINIYCGDFNSKLNEWNDQNSQFKAMSKHLSTQESVGAETELEISSDRFVLVEMTNDIIHEVLQSKTLEECKAFKTFSRTAQDSVALKTKLSQALKSSLSVSDSSLNKQKLQLINSIQENVTEHYSSQPHYHIGGPNGPIVWGSWGPNGGGSHQPYNPPHQPYNPPTYNPPHQPYHPPTYNPPHQPYNPPHYPTYPNYTNESTQAYRDGYNKGIGEGRSDRRNGIYFRPEYFGFSLLFKSDNYKRNYHQGYREGYRRGYYGYNAGNHNVNLYYRMLGASTQPSVSVPRTNNNYMIRK